MSGPEQGGWEPDARKVGNWRSMFEQPRQGDRPPTPPSPETTEAAVSPDRFDDSALADDAAVYRPWILQRGSGRPNLMLNFRRYEPRSGLWSGWAVAYPYLIGMEFTGDRLVSLDFGKSQVMITGIGLDELTRYIQQGAVVAVQEYAASVWPSRGDGPIVTHIQQVGKDGG